MKRILTVILVVMLTMTQTVFAESCPEFNFKSRSVILNSGYEMPILGLGMFSLSDSQAENSTYWALKAGFRLIDTARIYDNEAAVGRGLRRAIDEGIVTREDVFITTKMWTSDFDNGDSAIDASLQRPDDPAPFSAPQRCGRLPCHGMRCGRRQAPLHRPLQLLRSGGL